LNKKSLNPGISVMLHSNPFQAGSKTSSGESNNYITGPSKDNPTSSGSLVSVIQLVSLLLFFNRVPENSISVSTNSVGNSNSFHLTLLSLLPPKKEHTLMVYSLKELDGIMIKIILLMQNP